MDWGEIKFPPFLFPLFSLLMTTSESLEQNATLLLLKQAIHSNCPSYLDVNPYYYIPESANG